MRAAITLVLGALLIGGCSAGRTEPAFSISPSDDRFSDDNETSLYANGCRVVEVDRFGSYAGNGLGLFLNPAAFKDKASGNVNMCAFSITNSFAVIPGAALADTLGRIESVTFNADGAVISLEMSGRPDVFKSLGGGSIRHDHAFGLISRESMSAIIHAKDLAIKISGSHQSRVINNPQIEPAWRDKLRRFETEALQ